MDKKIAKISKYSDQDLQSYFDTEDIRILHEIKLYADDIYYNTGKSSGLNDWQYDMLKETIKRRDPHYLVPVGIRIRQHENRVKLPYWLGSMDKISVQTNAKNVFWDEHKEQVEKEVASNLGIKGDLKDERTWKKVSDETYKKFVTQFNERLNNMWKAINDDQQKVAKWQKAALHEYELEIAKWISDNKSDEYIIEDKLDGVSCLMVMTNGKIKLYTRGDGEVGADISYLAQYFSTIPKNLGVTLNVRGELIMKQNVFEKKYSKEYANPRNMVAGRIGGKTVRKGLDDIDFVVYEIVGNGTMDKPSDQLDYLDSLGFTTVRRELIKDITIDTLMETLIRFKSTSQYEIDGIIVQPNLPYERNTYGNPEYAFAFKMRLEGNLVEADVVGVDWNVSKWGRLKPRVEIKPVKLGGVTITWATGFNAKFIHDNSIGPGSVIEITRSGDVIPYIVKVVKKANEPDMPEIPYKWNETGVDIYTEEFGDEMCVKLIANFFAKLGIKHVGEKNVSKIYEAGYDTLLKIISASKEDFMEIPGFGSRLAERTHDNIHQGMRDLSLPTVLGASGVFGFGLGRKKITTLMDDIPNILEIYKKMTKKELLNRVLRVEGFSDKTAQKIVENVEWADKFIAALKNFATFKETLTIGDNMKDMKIVFTGFRDKKLEEEVVARGGKITTSVSKNTTVLVVSSKAGKPSGKMKKALDLGVEVLDKQEFIDKYIT